jgi:hypothetical protein
VLRRPSALWVISKSPVTPMLTILQIVSSIDSSPEILAQVQEVIIPIIRNTLENKVLGMWPKHEASTAVFPLTTLKDLFDNVYELVDSLTFKTRNISPNMWPVFESTYELFRTDAIDFLDGDRSLLCPHVRWLTLDPIRNAPIA